MMSKIVAPCTHLSNRFHGILHYWPLNTIEELLSRGIKSQCSQEMQFVMLFEAVLFCPSKINTIVPRDLYLHNNLIS